MGTNNQLALTRRGTEALARLPENMAQRRTPAADIYETPDAFVVKLDMPGATKGSMNLSVGSNVLTVKGIVGSDLTENPNVLASEVGTKTYFREFHLGDGLNLERANASFDLGVLTITLPKSESMKAKEIPIN